MTDSRDGNSKVVADDHSREELNKMALAEGLTEVDKYQNKPAVADAINRVRGGEDVQAVSKDFAPAPQQEDPQEEPTPASQPKAPKDGNSKVVADREQGYKEEEAKSIHAINGGHPTKFDSTGQPVYNPEEV